MKNDYIIFTDVSADIDPSFAKKNGIHFVSMNYTIGEEERVCLGIESEKILKKFYEGQRHGDLTKTSQISPQNYIDVFEPFLESRKSILYISLSSGLSGTYNSSLIAADELNERYESQVVCVDSLSGSAGMGLLIEAAVKNRNEKMSITENANWLEEHKRLIQHWIMVDDLMYLKRGGRVSAKTAVLGAALGIKPILSANEEGKLVNIGKKRGSKLAMAELVERYKETSNKEPGERVYIVNADSKKHAEHLKKSVLEINPNADVKVMMLSPIIGAHTGPSMLAIFHFGNESSKRE
ncbi:MAG: DegV family protein [Oscillospiraceae bacterium]|nr:DegV family protein [Oscillospiraceae bacterium]